jgi:hypothetical protein
MLLEEDSELLRECAEKRLELETVEIVEAADFGSGDAGFVILDNEDGRATWTRIAGREVARNWLPVGVDDAEEQTSSRIILNSSSSSSSSMAVWATTCRFTAE